VLKTITYIPVPLRALAKLGLKFSRDFSVIKGQESRDTRLLAEMTRLMEHI